MYLCSIVLPASRSSDLRVYSCALGLLAVIGPASKRDLQGLALAMDVKFHFQALSYVSVSFHRLYEGQYVKILYGHDPNDHCDVYQG